MENFERQHDDLVLYALRDSSPVQADQSFSDMIRAFEMKDHGHVRITEIDQAEARWKMRWMRKICTNT